MLFSCDGCSDTEPEHELINEDETKSKFEGKSFQILICSANAHGFSDLNGKDILQTIDQLKTDNDDIVIIGLQECYKDPKGINLPGYDIYAEGCSDNSIFVYQKKDFCIKQQASNLPLCHTQRYVNRITLSAANDLIIANTHLVGGRYDDQHWFKFPDGREQQLAQILTYKPDFILGDFNADVTDDISTIYWQNLLKLKKCTDTDKEAKLKKYKISGHQYLADNEYKSALDRHVICPTTPFKTVVDWIYYLKQNQSTKIKKITILGSGKIVAIPNLSDHNFPWVRLQIELS